MESARQQKYARLIQKELAEIFQRDTKSMFEKVWIGVTVVRMSPDLGVAKVFLSFMMTNDKQATLEKVRAQAKQIRRMLGERIRKNVRIIPELIFYIDDNSDYAAKMDDIFAKIEIPKEPKKNEEEEE